MSRVDLAQIIGTMDPLQLRALRVCIMAERRLRTIYPRDPVRQPALEEAYAWALDALPGEMLAELAT